MVLQCSSCRLSFEAHDEQEATGESWQLGSMRQRPTERMSRADC